ncbi:MAG: histidinol-phosphatase [Chloroflexi bacterium]|nr:histidinol-phosphatase [Chloroflexota bacterium]
MSEPSTRELLSFALELADAADALTLGAFRGGAAVRRKPDGTLVTEADEAAERELRTRIARRFPDHAVLGEEEGLGGAPEAPARWILDPIDGTHSFARGVPVWGTLIACERGGAMELGVASAPALGGRWWAGRGLGAYRSRSFEGRGAARGGERIGVSAVDRLEDAQVIFGSYRLAMRAWEGRAPLLLEASWRQRGYGDFWGHLLVAEGSAELMLDPAIAAWDIAALVPILEEAGGRLSDVDGRADLGIGHAISSNGALHEAALRVLRGEERPPRRPADLGATP